jgi:hypothetical protein
MAATTAPMNTAASISQLLRVCLETVPFIISLPPTRVGC